VDTDSIYKARMAVERTMVRSSPWQNELQDEPRSISAGVPAEFWHLVEESDQVIGVVSAVRQDEGINVLENVQLTRAERDFIELEALGERIFGEEIRLNRNIAPSGSKASDMNELTELVRSTIEAVVRGVERGDPEAIAFLAGGAASQISVSEARRKFARRLCDLGEELGSDSTIQEFLGGLANNDQAAMRRVVHDIQ
jgi:hypothetical protein